jgi:hypothetical protein
MTATVVDDDLVHCSSHVCGLSYLAVHFRDCRCLFAALANMHHIMRNTVPVGARIEVPSFKTSILASSTQCHQKTIMNIPCSVDTPMLFLIVRYCYV